MVYCRPGDLAGLATVGDGVEIRKSTIPQGGNGLYATRSFQAKQIITEYCGTVITRDVAVQIRQKDPSAISHFRSLGYHQVIAGLRRKEDADGEGGASFANDGCKLKLNNAKLATFEMRHTHEMRVFLVAERDIAAGEEILTAYGKDYWKPTKPVATPKVAGGRPQRAQQPTAFAGFRSTKAVASGSRDDTKPVLRERRAFGLQAAGLEQTVS
jgi:SET domain-containing protein